MSPVNLSDILFIYIHMHAVYKFTSSICPKRKAITVNKINLTFIQLLAIVGDAVGTICRFLTAAGPSIVTSMDMPLLKRMGRLTTIIVIHVYKALGQAQFCYFVICHMLILRK
ncbi:hypothetical protein ACJX0J_017840 [Zea mays]